MTTAPNTHGEILAVMILSTKPLTLRYLAGFNESNRTLQRADLPNHPVWILGHLALTMQRFSMRFDAGPLPDSDFVEGDGRQGDADRFDTESVSKDSTPSADPAHFPTLARAQDIFSTACDRMAAMLRTQPDTRFSEEVPWHDGMQRVDALVARLAFHNGLHAGQLTDLRRAMGLPFVIRPATSR
ncbi:MAG: DinB family protein [Planctomycetota bacterium]|nr:DinB family protein [Planctomycetota bacterium]MDA1106214.1 DinB family protein [Planctomycetota bacterium]